ncbi:DUF2155 domain-containing protein [Falsihalocynthiibacter sp. S25ZX9]|uniref:DUF2155 domain-containing protein n=1 Tax=Falsihalocynthiibacter sp. S25ZX9 TaxID=3240870 RepID=UPI0035109999
MNRSLCAVLAFCAMPAFAQTIIEEPLPSFDEELGIIGITTENRSLDVLNSNGDPFLESVETESVEQVSQGTGAVLRGLDRVSTELQDFELATGESFMVGPLLVTLKECRYPQDNPSGDAFAYLTIEDRLQGEIVFEGWMIGSAPALNALDHSRYDVWVLHCKTSSGDEIAPAE